MLHTCTTMMAPSVTTKRLKACYFLVVLVLISLLPTYSCIQPCSSSQEVYDIAFEFSNECSMTVSWEAPRECYYPVANYTVQSALGCPLIWINNVNQNGTTSSFFKTEDLELIGSCLRGECYVRISAELDRPEHSQNVFSHCYGISDTFYESYTTPLDLEYHDQHVCIPITSTCPSRTAPSFIINEQMIPWPFGSTTEDDIYVTGRSLLCIRNTEADTLVVHEVCHTDPNCHLCPVEDGEFLLMHRTEVQFEFTETDNRSLSTRMEDLNCAPCVASLCTTNNSAYKAEIVDGMLTVPRTCICLPLFDLQRSGVLWNDLIVEINVTLLYNSALSDQQNMSTSRIVNIPFTNASHCIDIDLMTNSNLVINGNASMKTCLTVLGSNTTKRCPHSRGKCVYSQVEITNGAGSDHTLSTILIPTVTVPSLVLVTAMIIIFVLCQRKYAAGGCGTKGDSGDLHGDRNDNNIDDGKYDTIDIKYIGDLCNIIDDDPGFGDSVDVVGEGVDDGDTDRGKVDKGDSFDSGLGD